MKRIAHKMMSLNPYKICRQNSAKNLIENSILQQVDQGNFVFAGASIPTYTGFAADWIALVAK